MNKITPTYAETPVSSEATARHLPYGSAFHTMKKWRKASSVLLWAVAVFSLLSPLLRQLPSGDEVALSVHVVGFANYLLIVSYYVVNVVTEVFLYPAAARQRRLNLIDNSLGSRFLGEASQGYFSNDDLPAGPYKLSVNAFENCFFTYHIAKVMQTGVVTKNAILSIVFLSLAYVGITTNVIGLPILQIFLSSLFLTDLIHHLTFVSRLSSLLERYKQFFMEATVNPDVKSELSYPILFLMDYETTLAYNKGPMSDKVYQAINRRLTDEWDRLKTYYKIGA